ncbi:MAG: tetraacyldisaccharide 4'-kinase [Hydrogenophaga sp.]|uniref:tetraacyldisaccharide 4'-kinase n=1 Tax=Hydrogenophaga sp. TaxID=1904254 RepID=UPI00271E9B43|nr:tetraacyldisaccharide 4'-kinase [Hydrogenophaga sp.]MDO9032609.1 tetraacyldisaccharide 4'-kinase [Hydrogenophaga sp.]
MPAAQPQRLDQGQARWQGIWRTRGPLAHVLWPVSVLYGALTGLRRWLYAAGMLKITRLPVPVIVVGNVVVGGAGKTPTVLALLQHLQQRGWHPGVVSRGHGRRGTGVLEVQPDTPATESGDEPALIRRSGGVPVFVAARRAEAAQALLAAHPGVDLILCDDGLQHLALGRDLSVAVFDDRATGNGWLLPAGLLREPWPPGAGNPFRPDLVLNQRSESASVVAMTTPLERPSDLPVFEATRRLADHAVGAQGQRRPLHEFKGQAVTALAGIARPSVFFDMLRARGLTLTKTLALPDHAEQATYAALLQGCDGPILCTEKDAVKLFACCPEPSAGGAPQAWAVPLELRPDAAFFEALDHRLASIPRAR